MSPADPKHKILRLVGLFPELLGIGGIQEVSRQSVRALQNISAQGEWSAAYLGLNDPPGRREYSLAEGPISLRGFGRSKARFVLAALHSARKSVRVVLAAHPNLAPPAVWMRRLTPLLKIIVMAHGIEVWEPLSAHRRAALLSADLVLAPSTSTARKLIEVQGLPPEKVRKLPWPLNSAVLEMAAEPHNLPLPQNFPPGPVILTVGRWVSSERYKGADDLIRALAQLRAAFPRLTLVAVGSGDDLPRLRQLAADHNVSASVHFLSGLSPRELAACYARADVFALPSAGEGFGLVFLEAMAFAKPIVAAAAGGSTDLVQDGVNGILVPPRDPAALAQALARLLGDEPLRSALGHRGAEIVRRQYRFDLFQSQFQAILSDCGLDSLPPA
ncbi:MAG: glycosyltransferase family 4 protein [Candidatus Acidiferrales bacterium]